MRIKALEKYPERYWDLIRYAQEEPIFIPCTSLTEARNLRNDLYNFRSQLRVEAEEKEDLHYLRDLSEGLHFKLSNRESQPTLVVGRTPSISDPIDLEETE